MPPAHRQPAYATVLAILEDGRPLRPSWKKAAAGAGKSRVKTSRLAAPSSWRRSAAVAIYCAGRTTPTCRRDGAPHMNRPLEPDPHTQVSRLAFHQGVADADRPRRDREGVRRLRKESIGRWSLPR